MGKLGLCLLLAAASLFNSTAMAQGMRSTAVEVERARDVCHRVMRIPQGFVLFYDCVDSLAQSAPRVVPQTDVAHLSTSFTGSGHTYSESSSEERRLKEELACQAMGHGANPTAFLFCVTALEAALHSSGRTE